MDAVICGVGSGSSPVTNPSIFDVMPDIHGITRCPVRPARRSRLRRPVSPRVCHLGSELGGWPRVFWMSLPHVGRLWWGLLGVGLVLSLGAVADAPDVTIRIREGTSVSA